MDKNENDIFTFSPAPEYTPPTEPFRIAALGLAHGHIYGMVDGLLAAGAEPALAYDQNPKLLSAFIARYPAFRAASSPQEIYSDESIRMIATADIPSHRAQTAIDAMLSGHDVVVDKAPLITLEQLEAVRETVNRTGRLYSVFYGESVSNPAAVYAKELLERGVIGRLAHIDGSAPHTLNPSSRGDWFFRRCNTGGIIIDLLCHQLHQVLSFSGAHILHIDTARAANRFHPEYPELDDFGDLAVSADNGVTAYMRVDWSSPSGIKTWGDARMTLCGSDGYIELRKNYDICHGGSGSYVYVANKDGEYCANVSGRVAMPYFRDLVAKSTANSRDEAELERELYAIELAIRAQQLTGRTI